MEGRTERGSKEGEERKKEEEQCQEAGRQSHVQVW